MIFQFHVAYSSIISGVGIYCGAPMLCMLQNECNWAPDQISVDKLTSDTMYSLPITF